MADQRTVRRETTEGTTPDGERVTTETVTETKTATPVPVTPGTTNVNVKTGTTDAGGAAGRTGGTGGGVSITTPEGTQVNVNS